MFKTEKDLSQIQLPFYKGPRQERTLFALILNECVACKDLTKFTGALNSAQIVSDLRAQGFEGIILTRIITAKDRDGKICKPGEYYIPKESRGIVRKALKQKTAQTAGTVKAAKVHKTSSSDNIKGGK